MLNSCLQPPGRRKLPAVKYFCPRWFGTCNYVLCSLELFRALSTTQFSKNVGLPINLCSSPTPSFPCTLRTKLHKYVLRIWSVKSLENLILFSVFEELICTLERSGVPSRMKKGGRKLDVNRGLARSSPSDFWTIEPWERVVLWLFSYKKHTS